MALFKVAKSTLLSSVGWCYWFRTLAGLSIEQWKRFCQNTKSSMFRIRNLEPRHSRLCGLVRLSIDLVNRTDPFISLLLQPTAEEDLTPPK